MMTKQMNERSRNTVVQCIEAAVALIVAFAAIYGVFSLKAIAAVTT